MRFGRLAAALAAATMAVTPAVAAPTNPAAGLSLGGDVRASSATADDKGDLAGGAGVIILALIGVGVAVAVIILTTREDTLPDSP